MSKLLFLILFVIVGCQTKDQKTSDKPFYDFSRMAPLDGRDTFLVVGDSISMGYTPYLVREFPQYQVIHNPGNASHSANGKANIDAWLTHSPRWKVCIFNHGLHDVRPYNVITPSDYQDNLEYEANAMLNVCDKVIFINTTWIPPKVNRNHYIIGAAQIYADAAAEVMDRLNIPICDLYSLSLTIKPLYKKANEMSNVHFTEPGSKILAQKIKECVNDL